ncbi:MAG: hypothetical protein HYV90_05190 [Candidatus Woesebacteria bacterium]|nr:MAG: hypothetical protein HYV90_05190 [Candidatus Woesebacteria bacterium]
MNADALEADGLETHNQNLSTKNEIPFSLRDFGEIPKGFIPVYILVSKESLQHVADNGFRVEDNRMNGRQQKLEEIFNQTAQDMGVGVDRTKRVFAFPRRPDRFNVGLSYDPKKSVIVEAMIDPKMQNAVVAEGEYYTEADSYLEGFGLEAARSYAKSYWETAKPLSEYLKEGHDGSEGDYGDFNLPEILIPENIPTSRMRVVK